MKINEPSPTSFRVCCAGGWDGWDEINRVLKISEKNSNFFFWGEKRKKAFVIMKVLLLSFDVKIFVQSINKKVRR